MSASILGIVSYSYSISTAQLISKNAIDTIHSNAQVSAHDIAEMLKNRISDIQSNIKIISRAPLVQAGHADLVHILFSTAQEETSDITDSYFWIDANGKLLWSNAFDNATLYSQFGGADTSFRDYYSVPKQTLEPYITKVVKSNDGIPRLFVAQPIISTETETPVFRGVIVSSINVATLGKFLESQLAPEFKSSTGMIDKEGQILYSTDASAIGQDVFGEEFQSKLPEDLKGVFNDFLRKSLQGVEGFQDISYQGSTGTLAYQPVKLNQETWAVLYVVTPHSFASTIQSAIDSQRNLSILTTIAIAAVAVGLAIFVIRWNKDLTLLVKGRTIELESKTEELRESNESLMTSNNKLSQAYEDLKVHDKMQKEFVNIAAHELRTPIQPILSVAEIFYEYAQKPGDKIEVQKDEIEMLFRNAKRLERLSSDILQVSRIEGSGLKLNLEEFDLCQKIRNVINDIGIRSHLQTSSAKIKFSPKREKIMIKADKAKIFEVISNLLSNAIKFTNEGMITIEVDTVNKTDETGLTAADAVVQIKDTGSGISPDVMPRLFSKFVSNDEVGGTGLGLYISKSIIEAHGGKIWGQNNNDGAGATFGFSLPLKAGVTAEASHIGQIVDRDPSIMNISTTAFEEKGVTNE